MNKPDAHKQDSLTEQVLELHAETFRQGMEKGMRRMAKIREIMDVHLHAAIRELDEEFNYTCWHEYLKDKPGCIRCGIRDPLT